jgi:hypothetical protein
MAAYTSAEQVAQIRQLLAQGMEPAAVAAQLDHGVDVATVTGIEQASPQVRTTATGAPIYRHRKYQTS